MCSRYIKQILWCAAVFALLGGCEEDVAAPSNPEEPFSMFGILNPRLNTQSMIVSPVEPLLYDLPPSIDAAVSSTDLETGETTVWRDTVAVGERGQLDHVFLADFRPDFGESHRIEVRRSDGAVSSAVATIPDEVDVASAENGSGLVRVTIEGASFHLLSIDVLYTVRLYSVGTTDINWCEPPGQTYAVSYTGAERATSEGYELTVNVELDHSRVMTQYSGNQAISWVPGSNGFALTRMQVRLLVAEKAWDPPGESFDENTLAQPGTMTNVTNGYGFVGGGYNHDARIFPSEEALEDTWFFDFMQRPPTDCLDYCSCAQQMSSRSRPEALIWRDSVTTALP